VIDPRARASSSSNEQQGGVLVGTLRGHRHEVCGLQYSHGEDKLASGGNDNKLLIWDVRRLQNRASGLNSSESNACLLRFNEHTAAVKGIAWSPHQEGLLVQFKNIIVLMLI
jgi:cell division cycle 20-like protein 1 (cofactor of APC complex)